MKWPGESELVFYVVDVKGKYSISFYAGILFGMPLAEGCNGELCNDVTYISTPCLIQGCSTVEGTVLRGPSHQSILISNRSGGPGNIAAL